MSEEQEIKGAQAISARTGRARRGPRVRKSSEADGISGDGKLGAISRPARPAIVVFSSDQQLVAMAAEAAGRDWVVRHSPDVGQAHEVMSRLKVRLVVMDDEKINPEMRGWLLEQIRKHAASALVIYIAAEHDLDGERRARSHPVQFYTARPLDADRVRRVLESFVRAAS
jgi:DNA-binding NtrC family response regulator